MVVISRRGRWVLAVPIGRLVFAAAMVGLCISGGFAWYVVLVNSLLAVIFLGVAVGGVRWVRRNGATLHTWEPELWAPFARRTMVVSRVRLVVRRQLSPHGASWQAQLDPDRPGPEPRPLLDNAICLGSYGHMNWGLAIARRSAQRVANALDLVPPS
jgi:hypothetical protein